MQVIGLALMALSLWSVWPSTAVVHANPDFDPEAGKKTWDAKLCKNCHGPQAEGKYALPLAGITRTLDFVIAQVRTPPNTMPAFDATKITDAELKDVYDYWLTLTKPASFTPVRYEAKPGDDPGKVLFNQKRCAACHGENAERLVQIVLGRGAETISLEEVQKQVRTPRRNMPVFRSEFVTDADIATIAPFVKAEVEQASGTAPAGLPKSGEEAPDATPWAVASGLAGVACLAVSFWLRRRTASVMRLSLVCCAPAVADHLQVCGRLIAGITQIRRGGATATPHAVWQPVCWPPTGSGAGRGLSHSAYRLTSPTLLRYTRLPEVHFS